MSLDVQTAGAITLFLIKINSFPAIIHIFNQSPLPTKFNLLVYNFVFKSFLVGSHVVNEHSSVRFGLYFNLQLLNSERSNHIRRFNPSYMIIDI